MMSLKSNFVVIVAVIVFTVQCSTTLDLQESAENEAEAHIGEHLKRFLAISKQPDTHNPLRFKFLGLLIKYLKETQILKTLSNKIHEAQGDPDKLIEIINSELHKNILRIEDDSIKINFEELIDFIESNVVSFSQTVFKDNLIAQYIVQRGLNSTVESHYSEWQKEVENIVIPISILKNYSFSHDKVREKRNALEDTQLDIASIIINLLSERLKILIEPVRSVINETCTNIIIVLSQYRTAKAPDNFISDIFAHAKNVTIQRLMEIIIFLNQETNKVLDMLEGNSDVNGTRSKRSAEFNELLKASDASSGGFSIITILLFPLNIIYQVAVSISRIVVTVIWRPIRYVISIFGPTFESAVLGIITNLQAMFYALFKYIVTAIRQIILNILMPLNCTLKKLVVVVFDRVKEIFASVFLEPVKVLVFSLVDRIIPCTQSCELVTSSLSL